MPSTSPLSMVSLGSTLAVSCDLFINGTGMTFSPAGLPSGMTGNIYLGSAPQGAPIGKFSEALTPILMNGQFVGTQGAGTFTFFVAPSFPIPLETISTSETSFIQGIVPQTGALEVGTTGAIVGSSGISPGLQGAFLSASVAQLGPQFQAGTEVQLELPLSQGWTAGLFLADLSALAARAAPSPTIALPNLANSSTIPLWAGTTPATAALWDQAEFNALIAWMAANASASSAT